MRALFLLLPLFLVGACSSIARENGDYFEAGSDIARFDTDAQTCAAEADDHVSYDLSAMDGTLYDRNRAYNIVYERCMRARGYRPRPYSRNWLPDA